MLTLWDVLWKSGVGALIMTPLFIFVGWMSGSFEIELTWVWRDLWVGVFASKEGPVYVCLIPTVVLKITPTRHL
jgi:hypothetical protein